MQSPGRPIDQDSHRAELTAIYGALHSIGSLLDTCVSPPPITIQYACDNLSALRYSFDHLLIPHIHSKHPDFDLLQAIRIYLHQRPFITINWSHIKGHQDKHFGPLSFLATLNVQADQLANVARSIITAPVPFFQFPSDTYIVTINGERIGKNFEQQLHDHYSSATMQPFWEKKRNINPNTFHFVDWLAINKATNSSAKHTARWITKHATGICGTNDNLLRWKQRDDDICPRCGQPETTLHVWQCTGHGAGDLWITWLSELESWLISQHTAPTLQAALLDHLHSWIFKPADTPSVRSFIETSQDLIGWNYIVEGVFSVEWARIQQRHMDSLGLRSTGHQWLVPSHQTLMANSLAYMVPPEHSCRRFQ